MSTAIRCFLLLVGLVLPATAPGADFTAVVNLPGDTLPDPILSGTQLNLYNGARLSRYIDEIPATALHGELNLFGGELSHRISPIGSWVFNLIDGDAKTVTARDQSTVNVGLESTNFLTALDASTINVVNSEFSTLEARNSANVTVTGSEGYRVTLHDDTTATIAGGINHGTLSLHGKSHATILSGRIQGDISVLDDAILELHGGEFYIDGEPFTFPSISGATVEIPLEFGRQVTGTLADGSIFGFTHERPNAAATSGRLRLAAAPLPTITPQYDLPGDTVAHSLRPGERLIVQSGGKVPNYFSAGAGSIFAMTGGEVGYGLRSFGAQILIVNGEIANGFRAMQGSEVYITGGTFGRSTRFEHSTVWIEGGTFGRRTGFEQSQPQIQGGTFEDVTFTANSTAKIEGGTFEETWLTGESTLQMTGGTTSRVVAEDQSHFTLAGGVINGHTAVDASSTMTFAGGVMAGVLKSRGAVRVVGGQFAVDGVPIDGLTSSGDTRDVNLPEGSTLTAILADGTPFVLNSDDGDEFYDRPLTLEAHAIPPAHPTTIFVRGIYDRRTLRTGQRLQIPRPSHVEDYFRAAPGSAIDILGGYLGDHFEGAGVTINVQTGNIHTGFKGFAGTLLQVTGGSVGNGGKLFDSRLELTTGKLGNNFQLNQRSEAVIEGGEIGYGFVVDSHSVADIHGGTFGNGLSVARGAVVNLHNGTLGRNTRVNEGGLLNVHGGSIGANLTIYAGGSLHLTGGKLMPSIQIEDEGMLTIVGTHFDLRKLLTDPATGEEVPLMDLLDLNTPYLLEARNTTLTATLADGNPFKLVLYTTAKADRDAAAEGARIFLVLVAVPEPATLAIAVTAMVLLWPLRWRR